MFRALSLSSDRPLFGGQTHSTNSFDKSKYVCVSIYGVRSKAVSLDYPFTHIFVLLQGVTELFGVIKVNIYARKIVAKIDSKIVVSSPDWIQEYKKVITPGTVNTDGSNGENGKHGVHGPQGGSTLFNMTT